MLVFTKTKVCYTNYATHKGCEAALNDKMIRRTQTATNYFLKDWTITPSLSASDRISVQDTGLTLSVSVMTYIWHMMYIPYKTACTNGLPYDEHMMFKTCRRLQELY
jgi:hypothetical protein